MEMLSNFAWMALSAVVLALTVLAIRRGSTRVSHGAALTTGVLLCLLLLPIVSMTDDLLESRQAALPLAAQSWHLAAESASVGLEVVSLVTTWLAFLALAFAAAFTPGSRPDCDARPHAAWLARAQRLRPPPVFAL